MDVAETSLVGTSGDTGCVLTYGVHFLSATGFRPNALLSGVRTEDPSDEGGSSHMSGVEHFWLSFWGLIQ